MPMKWGSNSKESAGNEEQTSPEKSKMHTNAKLLGEDFDSEEPMEKVTPELVAKVTGAKKPLKPNNERTPFEMGEGGFRAEGDIMNILQHFFEARSN